METYWLTWSSRCIAEYFKDDRIVDVIEEDKGKKLQGYKCEQPKNPWYIADGILLIIMWFRIYEVPLA